MQLLDTDLEGIANAIWLSVLDTEATPASDPAALEGRTVTACVHITGGWAGSVSVALPVSLAEEVAAAMFALDPSELSAADVHDAVGEIANIAGGNVKGMIDQECELSLPFVASGERYSLALPGTAVVSTAVMEANGVPFSLSLHSQC